MISILTANGIKSILSAIIASIIFHLFHKLSLHRKKHHLNDIVSYSSCIIAASRAIETDSKNPLIIDPLASMLAGPKAITEKLQGLKENNVSRIAIRTKYFDDYILDLLKRNVVQQVVLLGAGMDSRAFRFPFNNVVFYEIDNSNVLQLKEMKLQQAIKEQHPLENLIIKGNKRRLVIPYNIEKKHGCGWSVPLLQNGFNPSLSTIWVLEGLTYYISNEKIMSGVFKTMHDLSAANSHFIVSIATLESLNKARKTKSKLMQSWKWGTDDPKMFLSLDKCGPWIVEDVVTFGSAKANYGRYEIMDNAQKSGIMYVTGYI